MAEPVEQKLDIQDLLAQWERVVGEGREAAEQDPPTYQGEMYAFVARLMSSLPELAHQYVQHDDMCRAIHFLSEGGFEINLQFKGTYAECSGDLANGYILLARHHGWKPPRECD